MQQQKDARTRAAGPEISAADSAAARCSADLYPSPLYGPLSTRPSHTRCYTRRRWKKHISRESYPSAHPFLTTDQWDHHPYGGQTHKLLYGQWTHYLTISHCHMLLSYVSLHSIGDSKDLSRLGSTQQKLVPAYLFQLELRPPCGDSHPCCQSLDQWIDRASPSPAPVPALCIGPGPAGVPPLPSPVTPRSRWKSAANISISRCADAHNNLMPA